jgi:hypothetical protein
MDDKKITSSTLLIRSGSRGFDMMTYKTCSHPDRAEIDKKRLLNSALCEI